MAEDYKKLYQDLNDKLGKLGQEIPGTMSGFARMHKKSVEPGVLDSKTKELMALAIGIAVHCEGCIAFHTHDAVQAGASREEILETIGVALMMGGGPAAMYATYAMDAMEQNLAE